jgi:hypothetical protein
VNLESKQPPGPLFRVGRDRDAWAIPDWACAKEDGTFGNRFDDPMGYQSLIPAVGLFSLVPDRELCRLNESIEDVFRQS